MHYIIFWNDGAAAYLGTKDRATLIAATLNAPEERDILTYIGAFFHDGDKVQAQVAPIVCELLGRLSEDELACIPERYWNRLCPIPEDTHSGYSKEKNLEIYDQVHAAAFSAIMRLKRLESLANIENWMGCLRTKRHSGEFVRTLTECYETLLKQQATLPHSSTLLRPSSAEATNLNTLLRPITGTHSSETGAQLLRASTQQDPGNSDRNETSGAAATANDILQ